MKSLPLLNDFTFLVVEAGFTKGAPEQAILFAPKIVGGSVKFFQALGAGYPENSGHPLSSSRAISTLPV
jgi:hypothetical protein